MISRGQLELLAPAPVWYHSQCKKISDFRAPSTCDAWPRQPSQPCEELTLPTIKRPLRSKSVNFNKRISSSTQLGNSPVLAWAGRRGPPSKSYLRTIPIKSKRRNRDWADWSSPKKPITKLRSKSMKSWEKQFMTKRRSQKSERRQRERIGWRNNRDSWPRMKLEEQG